NVIRGKERLRTTIGRYPVIPLKDARIAAKKLLTEERIFDRHDPRRIERVLGYFGFAHCGVTQLNLRQELGLIALHEAEQPRAAAALLVCRLFRQLFASGL